MKTIAQVGSLLAFLSFPACDAPKPAPNSTEAEVSAEKKGGTSGTSKLVLGPQSPTPPIIPSPVPSLPANVKEGMERKDPEPGPDMVRPSEAPDPKAATKNDTPAPNDGQPK